MERPPPMSHSFLILFIKITRKEELKKRGEDFTSKVWRLANAKA
jgi:hypothetical protein